MAKLTVSEPQEHIVRLDLTLDEARALYKHLSREFPTQLSALYQLLFDRHDIGEYCRNHREWPIESK